MVLESNTLDLLFVKDGEQGTDGKVLYTWIKYAKDDKGTDMTDDPQSAVYIGISYNNESNVESDDPTQYAWTKIQGADGKKGEDAYTIVLENENISFATDENRNPLSEQAYTSRITVMKGATPVTDFGIGDIAKTQGIAITKGDDGISISVVNGNPLPTDSGEITVPISVGGTVFKKVLTWTCAKKGEQGVKGDKGDTGQKGQDGTSVKITSKSVTYQTSTSGTTAPTGTWSTTVPTVNNGQYLWTKTTVQYSDGNKTEAYSVSYKGTNGTNGTSVTVSKTEVTYQVSTSGTTTPTGTWSTTMPSCDQGQYLWTKTYVKYSDGKDTTSYSVSYKGVDGEKFAFNMLRETNQGSKHWVNMGASGKYSVESITTEDSINAVKLICTKPIASNEWQFCEFSDYEMLKSLKASTTYTLSYDIKTNRSGKISHNIKTGGGQKPFFANDISCKVLGNETWEHVSLKMTSGTTLPNLDRQVIYMFDNALSKVGYSIIKNLKLTEGIVDTPWAPHPEDLEGRGVSEIVQYYLATSQASGVTSSTSGWSTDITTQKLTADKKYLWNCSQTKYTDGTSEPITTPTIIGAYGDKGANALQCKRNWTGTYTTINGTALATLSDFNRTPVAGDVFTTLDGSSNTGTWQVISVNGSNVNIKLLSYVNSRGEKGDNAKNLSITPSSQYFKSTDGGKTFAPNQITITPTLQGDVTFGKWQYSIDGGVSFADVVSGQSGLSVDANKKLTIAKTSGLFTDKVTMVTFRAVASDSSFYDTCSIAKLYDVTDIEIGGVNLIKNSNFADGVHRWVLTGITYAVETDSTYGHHIKFSSSVVGDSNHRLFAGINDNFNHIEDTTYTLSFYAKASANTQLQTNVACSNNKNNYSLTTSWQRFTFTYKASGAGSLTFWAVEANKDIYLANIKLERGNKPTDYTVSPEDVQTAILSTKNSIENVSSKVDTNTKSIQDKVSKTTYEKELTLVKGDLSKANEGLNKWRYEIYPKSLFDSEDQGKNTIDIFARNLNLVPSQTVLLDDASLSTEMYYGDRHIAYALTFIKMSAKKNVTTKMFNDDSASLYVNGGLISSRGGDLVGTDVTFTLMQGWNCLEVVVNEQTAGEGFRFSTTLSKLSECQMMNCYYGTPVARQSRITNQLVDVTKNLTGVTSTVQDVMTAVGNSGNITEFKNNYSKWKQSVDKIETRVGEKYVTNEKFNGLEIGGRNLLTKDDCNMSKWQNLYPAHCKITSNDYLNHVDYVPTGGEWEIVYKKISVTKGQKYILSFDYKINKAYNYLSGQKYGVYLSTSVPTNAAPANIITNGQYVIENTVTNIKRGMITFTAAVDTLYIVINGGCIDDNQTGLSFEFNKWKLEKGSKATDWTPAPEDNEINGQNLVSNLPSNWEQGSFQDSKTNVGCDYDTNKVSMTTRIRVKELVPVSGSITISNAYSNQSKKPILHCITAFDVNKKWLGASYVSTAWSAFPRTVDMKDAKYIAVIVCYEDGSAITPSDISQICLKIERGTSATPFTLAPEDVNGKIVNVETIATQTATEIGWLINRNGSTASSLKLTENALTAIAENINLTGRVKFSSLSTDAKQGILNSFEVGGRNLALNTSNSYSTAFTSFSGVENTCFGLGQVTCQGIAIGDVVTVHLYIKYTDIVPASGQTARIWTQGSGNITVWNDGGFGGSEHKVISGSGEFEFLYSFTMSSAMYINTYWDCALRTDYIASGSIQYKAFKVEKGNKATDWTPAPEDYLPQANLVSNWTTNSTWIDGGKIYTGSITADKIAANAITADKIATDAIKSRNYISSGGTQGSFLNLSDGSFKSPNLSWDSNGNLIAKNANLSGQITATKGKIGSFNLDKSLYLSNNSPYYFSQFCAKKVYGLTNEGDIYIGSEGIYSYSWETGNMYIGDSGSIQADVSSSRGVCIENGEIYIYKSDYCKDYPTACDNKYGLVLAGGYVASANYSDGGSIDGFNFILTPNKFNINGKIYASNELQTGGDQIRIISGNIGCMVRNDSADFYILRTNSGDPYGGWTNDRPFRINWASNDITCGHNLTANDLIANSWVYCSEVHSSGAVVIASNSESYYWAHGYQMARGTSWGGVCIGDDSQGLRLYGTSIWASHSISTSDENLKENFTTLDQYEDFYMNLNPIGFNYIGDYDGKKTHFGFGAHKTEDILESEGYDSDKFAVVTHRPLVQEDIEKRFGKDVEVDIETEYGVSYTEFIALNTHMIQKTRKELEQVKQEKTDLEARLQAIEAKLGL